MKSADGNVKDTTLRAGIGKYTIDFGFGRRWAPCVYFQIIHKFMAIFNNQQNVVNLTLENVRNRDCGN